MSTSPQMEAAQGLKNAYVRHMARERLIRSITMTTYLQVRAHLEGRSYKQWLMSSTRGVQL